jgi:hypothetical protein
VDRYRDAYGVGATLAGLGGFIKAVGAILGGLLLVGALAAGDRLGGAAVLGGTFFAAVVGILCWVSGVIVAAQGQILLATLDTAVSSSRFLTDPERADAMGLPRSIAERSGRVPT